MESITEKLSKVYALAQHGATEGERAAAKQAMDRIMKKHNLDQRVLNDLDRKQYTFTYSTELELLLLTRIMMMMVPNAIQDSSRMKKKVHSMLRYVDYITIECAYEYFRRHMKQEYNRVLLPVLKKCRKSKTKTARRKQLGSIFFTNYVAASNLFKEGEIKMIGVDEISEKEYRDRQLMRGIQGGTFNRQLNGGLLLNESTL